MTTVEKVMTRNPKTCAPEDSLQQAAALMWDNDCGCIPVVSADGSLAGMITDRDICIAAFMQKRVLSEIPISTAMSRDVVVCEPSEPLAAAEEKMKTHQLHRLPVTNRSRQLVGILSLNDLALAATQTGQAKAKHLPEVGETLAAICVHRDVQRPALAS